MCILNVFSKNNKTGGMCKMKKSEKVSKKVLKVVERIVRNKAENVMDGDPPYCLGIYHQPKRPKRKED